MRRAAEQHCIIFVRQPGLLQPDRGGLLAHPPTLSLPLSKGTISLQQEGHWFNISSEGQHLY